MGSGGSAGLEIALAALSSISGEMGETCRESVGGRARGEPGVRRAETDCCSSMSTSVSIARASLGLKVAGPAQLRLAQLPTSILVSDFTFF